MSSKEVFCYLGALPESYGTESCGADVTYVAVSRLPYGIMFFILTFILEFRIKSR